MPFRCVAEYHPRRLETKSWQLWLRVLPTSRESCWVDARTRHATRALHGHYVSLFHTLEKNEDAAHGPFAVGDGAHPQDSDWRALALTQVHHGSRLSDSSLRGTARHNFALVEVTRYYWSSVRG